MSLIKPEKQPSFSRKITGKPEGNPKVWKRGGDTFTEAKDINTGRMKEYWPLEASEENRVYTFLSRGHKGNIKMMIQFVPEIADGVFNLAFGNQKSDNTLDDSVINDNGDRNKIIATVIKAVHEFSDYYPEAFVFFSGNTASRNRLYRAAISAHCETTWRNSMCGG